MKRKLLLPLSLLLVTSFMLASCTDMNNNATQDLTGHETSEVTEESEETEASETTETSGSIEETKAPEEAFVDLTASDEYGCLFPVFYSEMTNDTTASIAFCDSEGEIVCDPVFNIASRVEDTYWVFHMTGSGRKSGILSITGAKYTGCIYDSMFRSGDKTYCWTDDTLTVYDSDLNVIKEQPCKLKLDVFESNVSFNDLMIADTIGDDKVMVYPGTGTPAVVIDCNTGNPVITNIYKSYSDLGCSIIWSSEGYLIGDAEGNVIGEDVFRKVYDHSVYPILIDFEDNIHVFGKDGQEVFTGPSELFCVIKTQDHVLFMTDTDLWTVFDKDLNKVGVIEDVIEVTGDTTDEICYIENGDVKDYHTKQVIMENYDRNDPLYKYGGVYIANRLNSRADVLFADGRTVDLSDAIAINFNKDISTGKAYMEITEADCLKLYDIENDTTAKIDIDQYYSGYHKLIFDGRLLVTNGSVTKVFDITDPDNTVELKSLEVTN